MINVNHTVYYTYPILGFLKQQFKDENGLVKLTVSPKIRLKPIFYFYRESELMYVAIMKKSKNLMRFQLEISTPDGAHIATISEKPLFKKTSIFREYSIEIGKEFFHVEYKIANSSFTIENLSDTTVAKGKLVSPFIKNLLNFKTYKVNFYKNEFPEELWMAIVFGVFILD